MAVRVHASYHRRKPKNALIALGTIVRILLGTAALYLLVVTFFVSSVRVGSVSMEPAVTASDRLFVAPVVYGARIPWSAKRVPGLRAPARGDIVLMEAPQTAGRNALGQALDAVVRFLTLQNASVFPDERTSGVSRLIVKRVVGLPGDTIRMQGYAAWIRPPGQAEFSAERDLSTVAYAPNLLDAGSLPQGTPFGGDMAEVVLGDGQYFLLGDNRADSSDSRSWGPASIERIVGPVVLRYYPFRRFGRI